MFLAHVTSEDERWDQLAWHYYGDAHRYLPIVQANMHVPITGALPAGLTLAIPLLEPVEITEDLPPWMR
ncbi:tail protein X [Pseudomonas neuropathica]